MSQLRCSTCGHLRSARAATLGERCGVRLTSDVWCPGALVEHGCGGIKEACALFGCDECGGPPLSVGRIAKILGATRETAEEAALRVVNERDEAVAWGRAAEQASVEAEAEANSRFAIILGARDGETAEDAAERVVRERDEALSPVGLPSVHEVALRLIWRSNAPSVGDAFRVAEEFVAEAKRRAKEGP